MYLSTVRVASVQNFNSPIKTSLPKKQYLSLRHAVLAPLDSDGLGSDSLIKDNGCEGNSSPTKSLLSSHIYNKKVKICSQSQSQEFLTSTISSSSPGNNISQQYSNFSYLIPTYDPNKRLDEDPTNIIAPQNRISIAASASNTKQSNSDQIIIDTFLPSILRIACAISVAPSGIRFAELPKLPSVTDSKFDSVFYQKLQICSQIIDFTSTNDQVTQKEIKTKTICEFIELFENKRELSGITLKHQQLIFDMLSKNIFKQTPFFPSTILAADYSLTLVDPSWSHLFYCYQILNRFVQVFPESPLITLNVIKKTIDLTELPDTNERMQLLAFLRSYYSLHPENQSPMLKHVTNKLIDLHDGVATPFCALPLILFISHMFNKSQPSTLGEFKQTVKDGVLPLMSLPYLSMYSGSIKQLLSNMASSDSSLVLEFLRSIELQWPLLDGTKQVYFLQILIGIWEKMNLSAFKPMSTRVFTFLAEYVEAPQARVCQTILDIWDNVANDSWVAINSRSAIHAMYESVLNVVEKSWNKKSVEKASKALSEMYRINKHSYQTMKSYVNKVKAQRYKPRVPNDTQRNWSAIAKFAAESGDTSFDLNDKLQSIRDLFHHEKKPTLAVSRFSPVLESQKAKEKETDT